jgi:hypothetical protein
LPLTHYHRDSDARARGFDLDPSKKRVKNARAIVMDGAHRSTSRADTAFTADLLDQIAKIIPLCLFDIHVRILDAQHESFWAVHPVRS